MMRVLFIIDSVLDWQFQMNSVKDLKTLSSVKNRWRRHARFCISTKIY
jgi:hypothetical protein